LHLGDHRHSKAPCPMPRYARPGAWPEVGGRGGYGRWSRGNHPAGVGRTRCVVCDMPRASQVAAQSVAVVHHRAMEKRCGVQNLQEQDSRTKLLGGACRPGLYEQSAGREDRRGPARSRVGVMRGQMLEMEAVCLIEEGRRCARRKTVWRVEETGNGQPDTCSCRPFCLLQSWVTYRQLDSKANSGERPGLDTNTWPRHISNSPNLAAETGDGEQRSILGWC
jgi:hypothetical protein